MKTIIVYFSKSGRTKRTAEKIAAVTGSDLYEIQTRKKYPSNYFKTLGIARAELKRNEYPELAGRPDLSGYDRILLGFPIWFGTCPMAVLSFVKETSLEGKVIYPFCTSGASGCDKAGASISAAAAGAKVQRGRKANKVSEEMVREWLAEQEA